MVMEGFNDERLMAELKLLEGADPVSGLSLELARAAFDMRTMDAELAELVPETAFEDAVAVRAAGQPQLVSFEGTSGSIAIEVHEHGAGRVIKGYLDPPGDTTVAVLRPDGARASVPADDRGHFVAELDVGGPVKLVTASLETDWFVS
jgi:hypothetical protein